MKKLTETLIHQRLRTCTTDLDKVLQINITGRDLEDVSLLRKMTGVEILSLSVNKISTLVDFQDCKNLKELYLRHNNISDINEIFYLRNLPKLELLMLSENPCSSDPSYRMTVIKNLKNLVELDGIAITPAERKEAVKTGKNVLKIELVEQTGNCIPDGPQIQRTPTQSSHKIKHTESKVSESSEAKQNIEVIEEHEENGSRKMEETIKNESTENPCLNSELEIKISDLCEMCGGKGVKSFHKEEHKLINTEELITKIPFHCSYCKTQIPETHTRLSCERHFSRRIPKNTSNILSAILSLIKDLDYHSLQIVNAEVISCMSAFQIDLFYHSKT